MLGSAGPLLLAAIEGGVELLVFAVLLVLLVQGRDLVERHWRRGLVVAVLVLVLAVPQHLSTMFYIDPARMMGEELFGGSAELETIARGVTIGSIAVGAVFGTLLRMGWYLLVTCIAVGAWQTLRPAAPLLGSGLGAKARRLLGGLGIGLVVGAGSTLLFHGLEVDSGQALKQLAAYYPGLVDAGAGTRALVALPLSLTAALTEEIVFRGALLGALLRWGKERGWVIVAAVLSTSALWALLHLSLTDAPGLKLIQIFILGLGFAEITRRWGLEAAILAHLGLNVAGLVGMVLLAGG